MIIMEFNKLFKYIKALENESVFRNINKPLHENAFEDLLDQEDDLLDTQLALEMANDVRLCRYPQKRTSHYELAINNVFLRSVSFPTRYGDGNFSVWYGSLDQLTTIHETAYHMIRETIALKESQNLMERLVVRHRIIYKVNCTAIAILIDLTRDERFFTQLTDPINYSFTQQVGKRVSSGRYPGLLTPSARKKDGTNLAVFTPHILSNPVLSDHLEYQLDIQTMLLKVISKNTQDKELNRISIDGKLFQ